MYAKFCILLEKTGETSYQVSKATGISQTAFSNWKAGTFKPGLKSLIALSKHFDVTIEYFTDEDKGGGG